MALVLVLLLVAVVGYYALKLVKQRSAAFASAADGLGFTYSGARSPFEGTDMAGVTLFTHSMQHRYRNVLLPKDAAGPVVVPEFCYRILNISLKEMGSLTDGDTLQDRALVAWRIAHASLPRFQLFSRDNFGNMGIPLPAEVLKGAVRKAGLDLGSEDFSKRYVLIAEDETPVRMLFSPFLVRSLLEQPPRTWLHIQVSADWLVFFDPAIILLDPQAVPGALARIQPIADRILGRSDAAAA